MKRIVAVLLCVVSFCAMLIPAVAAEDTTKYKLEIKPENRYTNISEMDEYNKQIFGDEIEAGQEKEGNKIIYISVLCVLLVVAVVVLVVSLKRVPPEDGEDTAVDPDIKKKNKSDSKDTKKK